MLRAATYVLTIAGYSELALLAGTNPDALHSGLEMWLTSPRSVRATILRVLVVVPVLFVTQTSTRLMLTPLLTVGNEAIHSSYLSRK